MYKTGPAYYTNFTINYELDAVENPVEYLEQWAIQQVSTLCAIHPLSISTIKHDFSTAVNDTKMCEDTQRIFTYITANTEDVIERMLELGYLTIVGK